MTHEYNREAVQREITRDPRIKPGEARLIHALLKGRTPTCTPSTTSRPQSE